MPLIIPYGAYALAMVDLRRDLTNVTSNNDCGRLLVMHSSEFEYDHFYVIIGRWSRCFENQLSAYFSTWINAAKV